MSYQPGIFIPEFYLQDAVSSWLSLSTAIRTTVIGIVGAFGKTNLTSSNLPRLRQFSARPILCVLISKGFCSEWK